MWNKKNIILASKSPRRFQILSEAGFDVEVVSADVEEDYPANMNENEIAEFLAIKKSNPFIGKIPEEKILIAADSIVVHGGIVYGKPADFSDAVHTLEVLSNEVHKVYTGVSILSPDKQISFTEMAEIKFAQLSMEEITFYINHQKPFDKAGAYGIQDWIGLCKVEWIKGTMSNIMGLPMALLYKKLSENNF